MDEANFQNQILAMKRELLALKQRQGVIAVSPAGFYRYTESLTSGRHTITYKDGDYPILSFLYGVGGSRLVGLTAASTPVNNTQYFWVPRTVTAPGVMVVSNREIKSIQ